VLSDSVREYGVREYASSYAWFGAARAASVSRRATRAPAHPRTDAPISRNVLTYLVLTYFLYVLPTARRSFVFPTCTRRAASTVLRRSMAMVMGPTPPGTGVMWLAFPATASKSTSPLIT
jgi:hypothetical protein